MLFGSRKYNWVPGAPKEREQMGGSDSQGREVHAGVSPRPGGDDQPPQSWRHCGPTSVKDSLPNSKHFLQEEHRLCALIHFFCGQSHFKF